MQQTLFTNVPVLDCTGAAAYAGEVLIEGNRIKEVFRAGDKSGSAPRTETCGSSTVAARR
jgi:hypothetical protein